MRDKSRDEQIERWAEHIKKSKESLSAFNEFINA